MGVKEKIRPEAIRQGDKMGATRTFALVESSGAARQLRCSRAQGGVVDKAEENGRLFRMRVIQRPARDGGSVRRKSQSVGGVRFCALRVARNLGSFPHAGESTLAIVWLRPSCLASVVA